jgi:hypothetical protein
MRIKIAIGVVLVAVLVVIAVVLLSGGDDDAGKSSTPAARNGGSGGGGPSGTASQPPLRTIMTKRASGLHATLAAGALLTAPGEIWMRVSAAPKQEVKGTWNVTCGKLGTSMDTFAVTPPSIIRLELPGPKPKSCAVGSSAQLSGKGRLKVAILRDR